MTKAVARNGAALKRNMAVDMAGISTRARKGVRTNPLMLQA